MRRRRMGSRGCDEEAAGGAGGGKSGGPRVTAARAEQLQLFGGVSEQREKRQKLDGVVDTIRSRYGKNAIAYASVMKRPEGGGDADE